MEPTAAAPAAAPAASVYDTIGLGYTTNRQADPRWTELIHAHLGGARRIVNVGAGTGSYEPADPSFAVVAVEPSAVMVGQRPAGSAPAVRGSGTALPLRSGSADAVLAILTLHHWDDWRAGLSELCRVAPRRVILTIDFAVHARFWLLEDYFWEVADRERNLHPSVEEIAGSIPVSRLVELPLPADLADGVLGAHWNRPEAYLDPVVRANTSPLALADPHVVRRGIDRLRAELASGVWHERHGALLTQPSLDLGYRLIVSEDG